MLRRRRRSGRVVTTMQPPSRLSRRSIVTLVVTSGLSAALLLLLLSRLLAASRVVGAVATFQLAGHPAPDFAIQTWTWDGSPTQTVRLSAFAGHPAVVNFWASWCDACREEELVLEAAYLKYQPQGVMFFGVAYQDSEPDGVAFLHQYRVTFPSGPPVAVTTPTDYAVTGIPETVFIDRHGIAVRKWQGAIDDGTLGRQIQALLGKP